ncbi:MAG TPA: TetR/AcrR family transcriptional regulator [Ilumatobacteraceae bacterium]|nr:TetR/AcrR family transcriptional regulator [Ilumatobacteraceae bacterium]
MQATQPTRRPGGRTARTQQAVHTAALAELADHGYAGTSIDSIARRAGVHPTTVYRRWQTKGRVIAEALRAAAAERTELIDTGSIDDDMRTLARSVVLTLSSREGLATVRALVAEGPTSPDMGPVLDEFWAGRRAAFEPFLERAIERGQLPADTDAVELLKYLAAPIYYQALITTEALSAATADRAAAATMAAARANVFDRFDADRVRARG